MIECIPLTEMNEVFECALYSCLVHQSFCETSMSELSLKEMNNEPASILRTANLNSAYSFPAAYEGLLLNIYIQYFL